MEREKTSLAQQGVVTTDGRDLGKALRSAAEKATFPDGTALTEASMCLRRLLQQAVHDCDYVAVAAIADALRAMALNRL
ncbi:MAG TPA: hypothetical protein VFJ24_08355 [Gaiellales bacterium]|nr:hypothetical protein [Gaiellales bacterium]